MSKPNIIIVKDSAIPSKRTNTLQTLAMAKAFSKIANTQLWLPKIRAKTNPEVGYIRLIPSLRIYKQNHWINIVGSYLLKLTFYFNILRALINQPPSIVLSREPEVIALKRLGILRKHRFFYEIHQIPTHPYNKLWNSIALNQADQIIAITQGLKDHYSTIKAKINILPDGVKESWLTKPRDKIELKRIINKYNKKNKKIILYAGTNLNWKGVKTIEVAAKNDNNPNHQYLIIGFKKENTNNIKYIDRVDQESVRSFYLIADILVIPNSAKYKISSHFTSPLKLFEYMAVQKPIICSDLPSLREIVSKNEVWFFEPDSASSLLQTIQVVEKTPQIEIDTKVSKAFQLVKNYTWEKRAREIIQL